MKQLVFSAKWSRPCYGYDVTPPIFVYVTLSSLARAALQAGLPTCKKMGQDCSLGQGNILTVYDSLDGAKNWKEHQHENR